MHINTTAHTRNYTSHPDTNTQAQTLYWAIICNKSDVTCRLRGADNNKTRNSAASVWLIDRVKLFLRFHNFPDAHVYKWGRQVFALHQLILFKWLKCITETVMTECHDSYGYVKGYRVPCRPPPNWFFFYNKELKGTGLFFFLKQIDMRYFSSSKQINWKCFLLARWVGCRNTTPCLTHPLR